MEREEDMPTNNLTVYEKNGQKGSCLTDILLNVRILNGALWPKQPGCKLFKRYNVAYSEF